jgi:hypothetical protein
MQYTITVNQFAFCKYFPLLNISHAAIVDWFTRFTHSSKISRLEHEGKIYYWLQYDKAREELPILGISSKDSMRRLIKALCNENILEAHPHNQAMGRSYFAFGDRYDLMHTSADLVPESPRVGKKSQGSYSDARGGRTEKNEGVVPKCTTDPYIHDHDSKDQKEKPNFSLSENSNLGNSENLEVSDLAKNPIPDQQGLNDRNPEKKESSAKERKTAAPQIWSEQQILLAWNANRPKSWLPYSPGTLISSAVQNGLDHILQNFGGGDRKKTCEIIATTLKYISTNEAWLSSQHFTAKQSLSLEHGAGNKRFLGDYVPAALQALEKANKPQSVERLPLPLPTTSNNIFSAQIKELFNERCTEQ